MSNWDEFAKEVRPVIGEHSSGVTRGGSIDPDRLLSQLKPLVAPNGDSTPLNEIKTNFGGLTEVMNKTHDQLYA